MINHANILKPQQIKNHPKVVLVFLGGPGRNRPGLRMLGPNSRLSLKAELEQIVSGRQSPTARDTVGHSKH